MCWLNVARGLVVITAYFWTGEGWSPRNNELMKHIYCTVSVLQCLWVLAGDTNMDPGTFADGAWVRATSGQVAAPREGEATYKSGETSSTLDFFLLHPALADAFEGVNVLHGAARSKHSPVELLLNLAPCRQFINTRAVPKQLPIEIPIGCLPPPLVWPEIPQSIDDSDTATSLWAAIMDTTEREVLAACGETVQGSKGKTGRAKEP